MCAPAIRGLFLCARVYDRGRAGTRRGSGIVGVRGRLGRWIADEAGKKTPLDADVVAVAIGAYLFVSRTRRMLQMLARLRQG
jgi:hypothetical protein